MLDSNKSQHLGLVVAMSFPISITYIHIRMKMVLYYILKSSRNYNNFRASTVLLTHFIYKLRLPWRSQNFTICRALSINSAVSSSRKKSFTECFKVTVLILYHISGRYSRLIQATKYMCCECFKSVCVDNSQQTLASVLCRSMPVFFTSFCPTTTKNFFFFSGNSISLTYSFQSSWLLCFPSICRIKLHT